ncbi:hypothetical protein GCM10016234_02350 [Tianweitania populi]|uniref:Uncharacterized protein n=1 Tax=Tianweitania populi TaxID=1607949 RepID=A0A8J3DTJ9_9HYPH|nr:hypothetical protein GCM10016234_02350 [Tianweitania populi]
MTVFIRGGAKLEHPSSDFAFGSATARGESRASPALRAPQGEKGEQHPYRFVILRLDPRIHAMTVN